MPRRAASKESEDPMMDRLAAMILAATTAMEAALEMIEERAPQATVRAMPTQRRRRRRRTAGKRAEE